MEFGIFDQLDATGQPLDEFYEDRLRFVELCERVGFRGYYLGEHHATPLCLAPSPSVFLAAIATRTDRIRFGTLVYALPLYHPLRLLQEICVLDQMGRGRLDLGVGRGASPIETSFFGIDLADSEDIYRTYLDLILTGLTEGRLDGVWGDMSFDDVPLHVAPFQKPHPPLWYGAHSTDSAARAARMGSNIVSLDDAAQTRTFADAFRTVWAEAQPAAAPEPLVGLGMPIVVAEDDDTALEIARRAYPAWHKSFNWLYVERNAPPPKRQRPTEFDGLAAQGRAIAGSPATVASFLKEALEEAGANYFVGQFAFGDLSLAELSASAELFAGDVMPALRASLP